MRGWEKYQGCCEGNKKRKRVGGRYATNVNRKICIQDVLYIVSTIRYVSILQGIRTWIYNMFCCIITYRCICTYPGAIHSISVTVLFEEDILGSASGSAPSIRGGTGVSSSKVRVQRVFGSQLRRRCRNVDPR